MLADLHEQRLKALFDKKMSTKQPAPLKAMKELAWKRALQIGLPDQKSESVRYGGLKTLYRAEFEVPPAISMEPQTVETLDGAVPIVFFEGQYSEEKSAASKVDGVVILPIEKAWNEYGLFLQNRLSQSIKTASNVFHLLNGALQEGGVFIYVPPGVQVEQPIEFQNMYSGKPTYATPFVQILVGAGSSIKVLETSHNLQGGEGIINAFVDIALEEDASCDYYSHMEKGIPSIVMNNYRATCKTKSRLNMILSNGGAKLFQQNFDVEILGEEVDASLKGVWALEETDRSNTNILITHKAPASISNQHFKGIVKGKSRSAFDGKIYIHPEAQKTLAYQLNNNLILEEGATAFTKPNLEIFADDVKASHGATIAQMNEEEMFYMQTRGIKPLDAKKHLIVGFLDAITRQVPFEQVRGKMRESYVQQ